MTNKDFWPKKNHEKWGYEVSEWQQRCVSYIFTCFSIKFKFPEHFFPKFKSHIFNVISDPIVCLYCFFKGIFFRGNLRFEISSSTEQMLFQCRVRWQHTFIFFQFMLQLERVIVNILRLNHIWDLPWNGGDID